MSTYLISILMPAYNCENYVKKAIDSIVDQTYTNWELLVADDGSTDSTKQIIDSYRDPRIKCFHNERNIGYLKTWNKLISLTKGDFITFQDADDYSAPNRLETLMTAFGNDTISVVGSNYIQVDTNNLILNESNFVLDYQNIVDRMPYEYNFVGSAIMIRRCVYESIGGYNEFFDRIGGEDLYWVYLISEKYKIINVSERLYYYRLNFNSVSGNIANNPCKLFVSQLLSFLIEDRKKRGVDMLSEGNIDKLREMLEDWTMPFYDNAYYFWFIAQRRYYEGYKKIALKLMYKAILKCPIRLQYYKDFLYILRN